VRDSHEFKESKELKELKESNNSREHADSFNFRSDLKFENID